MKNLLRIKFNPNRIYGLDIIRGMAIVFVVIAHGRQVLPESLKPIHNYITLDGVSLFFVLSGFLIGGILIRNFESKRIDGNLLVNFWIRRWCRTLPNYFLVLIVLMIFGFMYTDGFTFNSVARYFYFSQNLWYPQGEFFPESWSLSVEEWFYLLIPMILFFAVIVLRVRPKYAVIVTAVTIIIVITTFRYIRFTSVELETLKSFDELFRQQVITRLDSIMYGIIGAYIAYYHNKTWQRYKVVLLVVGLIILVGSKVATINGLYPVRGMLNCVFSFSIFSFGTLLTLPFLSNLRTGKGFVYRAISYLSVISYSMYLVNDSFVRRRITQRIPWEDFLGDNFISVSIEYIAFWFFTIAIAALIYKYFEMPMMKLRDHKKIKALFPVRSKRNSQIPN